MVLLALPLRPRQKESMRTDQPIASSGVDFSTFVMSLGSSALMHLGALAGPDGKTADLNLQLAQQTIDVLSLLEEKTRNNLTAEEGELLTGLLYDLRLRYIECARSRK